MAAHEEGTGFQVAGRRVSGQAHVEALEADGNEGQHRRLESDGRVSVIRRKVEPEGQSVVSWGGWYRRQRQLLIVAAKLSGRRGLRDVDALAEVVRPSGGLGVPTFKQKAFGWLAFPGTVGPVASAVEPVVFVTRRDGWRG